MRLFIENFGPIRRYATDLSQGYNFIIGEQATGKSTIAKTAYFCRKIRDFLIDYLCDQTKLLSLHPDERYVGFLKYCRKKFMSCFGTTKHMGNFIIRYNYTAEYLVSITLGNDRYARFQFSPIFRERINSLILDTTSLYGNLIEESSALYDRFINFQDFYINRLQKTVYSLFNDDADILYIPAGRSLVTLLSNHLAAFPEIDTPTNDFINRIASIKRNYGGKLSEIVTNFTKLFSGQIYSRKVRLALDLITDILKADYSNESDGEKLYFSDREWVHLRFGSSGQQEALWILVIMLVGILEKRKSFIVIEEPEAHLFPAAQKDMMKLIILMHTSTSSSIFITTHSPYIISSINLFMYSHRVEGRTISDHDVIDLDYRVPADIVNATYLERSDLYIVSRNIVDYDASMIETQYIDSISNAINIELDKLIEKEANR